MFRNRSGRPRSAISRTGAGRDDAERDLSCDRGGAVVAGGVAGERDERRARRHPAEPEVGRDVPAPDRCVDERPVDLRDRRAAHPSVRRRDLPRGRPCAGIAGVARLVQIRPLGVAKVGARERDRRLRLGRGPRARSAARTERRSDVAGAGVVVGHPLGRPCAGGVRSLVLRSQLRRLAGVLEPVLRAALGAHQVPPPDVLRVDDARR